MGKIALVVEYEGTRYHGSQLQANAATIQGEIECALSRLTGEANRISCASRTDAGVHARGQVVGLDTNVNLPLKTFIRALNHYLPQDIALRKAFPVSDDFDVRRNAISREYCYHLLNSTTPSPLLRMSAYFVPQPLDVAAMNEACKALIGTHDFAPFASSLNGRKNTVRTVYRAEAIRDGELVAFHMVASSFLPHQVRNTIGALVKVGLGKCNVETFCQIARSKKPASAGPALPAYGLCLVKVNYPDGVMDENL